MFWIVDLVVRASIGDNFVLTNDGIWYRPDFIPINLVKHPSMRHSTSLNTKIEYVTI